MGLVVRTADGPFCLRVDAVCDVVVLDDASIEPPPASLDPAARALVRGVALCDEGVVLLLDLDALLRAIDGATDKVG
jgi:chemotaxis signal transduction protein